jgi:hypothetical protein
MATKKTNNGAKSKNTENGQKSWASSLLGFLRRRWWVVSIIGLLVFGVSLFAYEKHLDRQNVADMKQLLGDFEQLEKDVEAETGEKLFIEASCGSVGKFSTSYSCRLVLAGTDLSLFENAVNISSSGTKYNGCEFLYNGKDEFKNALRCDITVRGKNIGASEEIFYKYDTSPGSPG